MVDFWAVKKHACPPFSLQFRNRKFSIQTWVCCLGILHKALWLARREPISWLENNLCFLSRLLIFSGLLSITRSPPHPPSPHTTPWYTLKMITPPTTDIFDLHSPLHKHHKSGPQTVCVVVLGWEQVRKACAHVYLISLQYYDRNMLPTCNAHKLVFRTILLYCCSIVGLPITLWIIQISKKKLSKAQLWVLI